MAVQNSWQALNVPNITPSQSNILLKRVLSGSPWENELLNILSYEFSFSLFLLGTVANSHSPNESFI